MGDFRIVIDAVGGHGQDRENKGDRPLEFPEGSPEKIMLDAVNALIASCCSVEKAVVVHWPADNYGGPEQNERIAGAEIVDDLLTGTRRGSF